MRRILQLGVNLHSTEKLLLFQSSSSPISAPVLNPSAGLARLVLRGLTFTQTFNDATSILTDVLRHPQRFDLPITPEDEILNLSIFAALLSV